MLSILHKHSLISAALMASLSITACGKKKDLISPPPPPPSKPQETAPQSQSPTNPPNVIDKRPQPEPSPAPPPAPTLTQLPPDYKANDPQNVTSDVFTKRMTGGLGQDGLAYTSSSTDQLLSFLRARNDKVDVITRRTNLDAAVSIQSAAMSVDPLSGDSVITLKIQEGSDVKVYNVAGVSNYGGSASLLRSVQSGNEESTTGGRPLEGTLKCLDLDGGCETSFARLKIGAPGSSAILNLVFRNSSADLYFHLPAADAHSENSEFVELQNFVLNTVRKVDTNDRIKSVRMSSWEVVNGRSGVILAIRGYNNELLAFEGPLLAPEAGTGVNVALSRVAENKKDSLNLISLNNTKLTYANWISEARMVANNGLGQVRVALKMRKRGSYAQDQFSVTFMRTIKPIVELTDSNLK